MSRPEDHAGPIAAALRALAEALAVSRADELERAGANVQVCKYCGRRVVFAVDAKGTSVCLDPSAPTYSLGEGLRECFRSRGSYVSHHHVTCREFQAAQAKERDEAKA